MKNHLEEEAGTAKWSYMDVGSRLHETHPKAMRWFCVQNFPFNYSLSILENRVKFIFCGSRLWAYSFVSKGSPQFFSFLL